MTREKTRQLAQLANNLTEILMTAAICAEKIRATVMTELEISRALHDKHSNDAPPSEPVSANHGPIVDHSTFSLAWHGKTCYLGYTVLFRLADRLSRRPNQYVTPEQLLRDVWFGDLRSPDTIRSAIRHLRHRLQYAGMTDLATAIRGQGGRYGLILHDDM